jgi:anti-sigma factor RsiW
MGSSAHSNEKPASCEEVRDLLHAFVGNELEAPDTRLVLERLLRCQDCLDAMAEHVRLAGVLRASLPSFTKPYVTFRRGFPN